MKLKFGWMAALALAAGVAGGGGGFHPQRSTGTTTSPPTPSLPSRRRAGSMCATTSTTATPPLQGKLLTGGSWLRRGYPSVGTPASRSRRHLPAARQVAPAHPSIDLLILEAVAVADRAIATSALHVVPPPAAINVDKVKKASTAGCPGTPGDLFSIPALTARLKGCGIALMDEASDAIRRLACRRRPRPVRGMDPPTSALRSSTSVRCASTSAASTPRRSSRWPRAAQWR